MFLRIRRCEPLLERINFEKKKAKESNSGKGRGEEGFLEDKALRLIVSSFFPF